MQYDFTTIYQLGNYIRYQAHPLPETESILCAYMNCIVYLFDVMSWRFFTVLYYLSDFFAWHYVIGISILFENINLVFCFNWIIINFSHFSPPNEAFLLRHFTTGESRRNCLRSMHSTSSSPCWASKTYKLLQLRIFGALMRSMCLGFFQNALIFVHESIWIF